jgi:glycerophosphoryl diester phosphodiesterase
VLGDDPILAPGRHVYRGRPILILGHRGVAARAPENTLASVRAALETGVDGIEIDVRPTADDVVVLLHDETLDRTRQGSGLVRAVTWTTARAGGVASLEEVLAEIDGRSGLNIEIKDASVWSGLRAILERETRTTCWVSSFDLEILAKVSSDGFPVGILASARRRRWRPEQLLETARRLNARALHLPVDLATDDVIRGAAVPVLVWTVNDPGVADDLLARGVDGVFSDDPGLLIAELSLRR